MPKILTDAYKDATYCLPYTADKKECAFIRPVTETMRNEIRRQVAKEAGADTVLAEQLFTRALLKKAVIGWQGFFDVSGKEIPFSAAALDDICACDPDFAAMLLARIVAVARLGELDEEKN